MKINNQHTIEDIKSYSDLFFHTIFADPPYNLSSEVYIDTDGKPKFKQARDFMNKWKFDHEEWGQFGTEAFRVLKYGGYCLLFGMDRQLFLIEYYMKKAGFDICQSLHWFFISNFPKAMDASKIIDRRLGCKREIIGKLNNHISEINNNNVTGIQTYSKYNNNKDKTAPASDFAKQFEGHKYGIAPLKQMTETIMIFRKPPKQSILDDILSEDPECSPSVLNIDGGRVEFQSNDYENYKNKRESFNGTRGKSYKKITGSCQMNVSPLENNIQSNGRYPTTTFIDQGIADNIDEQSGDRKGWQSQNHSTKFNPYGGNSLQKSETERQGKHEGFNDSGGASRVMHICGYDEEEYNLLNYFPKVSGKERNAGLDGLEKKDAKLGNGSGRRISGGKDNDPYSELLYANNHPTLKPIELIYRIAQLFKLPIPEQNVYIPFSGVWSEIIGFVKAGYNEENIYGCELEQDWMNIGPLRLEYWRNKFKEDKQQLNLFEVNQWNDQN